MIPNILPTFRSLITNVVAQLTKMCRLVILSPSCQRPNWFVTQMTVQYT